MHELVVALGAELLVLSNEKATTVEARADMERVLSDGSALAKFRAMVVAVGGDPRAVDEPEAFLPQAPVQEDVLAPASGIIQDMDALDIAGRPTSPHMHGCG